MNGNETIERVYESILNDVDILFKLGDRHHAADVKTYASKLMEAHGREIEAKDAEIEKLRTLVKELADALEKLESIGVDCSCCGIPCDRLDRHEGCIVDGIGALVAKAREAVK